MIFKERFDKLISNLEEKIRTHYPAFDFEIVDKNSDANAEIIEFQHNDRTLIALFLLDDITRVCSEVVMLPISDEEFIKLGLGFVGNQIGVLLFENNFEQKVERVEFSPEKKILCKNIDIAVETIYTKIEEQLIKLGYLPV